MFVCCRKKLVITPFFRSKSHVIIFPIFHCLNSSFNEQLLAVENSVVSRIQLRGLFIRCWFVWITKFLFFSA